MDSAAKRGCQTKGIFRIPLKFRIAIEAVKRNDERVMITEIQYQGLSKNQGVGDLLEHLAHSTFTVPCRLGSIISV